MGTEFGTPNISNERSITQTYPHAKKRLSFTPVKVKNKIHFVDTSNVDEDDDSNCVDID